MSLGIVVRRYSKSSAALRPPQLERNVAPLWESGVWHALQWARKISAPLRAWASEYTPVRLEDAGEKLALESTADVAAD